jgi:hypothetical protein
MKIWTPLVHSGRSYAGNLALLVLALNSRLPQCGDFVRYQKPCSYWTEPPQGAAKAVQLAVAA